MNQLIQNPASFYYILIILFIDAMIDIWVVCSSKTNAIELTRIEREVILDALETYQAVIVRSPDAFGYPLDQVSDYVHNIDLLKERIK